MHKKTKKDQKVLHEALWAKMYPAPAQFTMKQGTPLTLEISGEQYPMFVCLPSLTKEMQTPIYALVTDIGEEDNEDGSSVGGSIDRYLGSQVHYVDDQRRCFSTNAVWSGTERKFTRIEFSGDATDYDGKPLGDISITLEVNLSQLTLRTLVRYKWLMLN